MKYFLFSILILTAFLLPRGARAQVSFTVDHFSPTYYGKVTVADTSEVFSQGTVAIFERGNPEPVIEVASDELAVHLHDGAVYANIRELPYGEQSVIIFEDFNFDGKKDFAIEDGQNSCYHGPSFRVYLAGINGFSFSEAFTDLAQSYCGMFDVDTTFHTLHTMTKDGCCWHQFSEFIVERNEPKAVHVIEEDARRMPFIMVTEQKWDGVQMKETVSQVFDTSGQDLSVILSFPIAGKNKQVWVYSSDNILWYVMLGPDAAVELAYPASDSAAPFRYDPNAGTLSFKNKDAAYSIVDNNGKTGILIRWKGKETFWPAGRGRKGSLKKLLEQMPANVQVK